MSILIHTYVRGVRRLVTLSALQTKEVVLLKEGERIGFIDDVELDEATGHITALIVIGKQLKGALLFQRQEEIVIPWEHIVTIGRDFILISTDANKVEVAQEIGKNVE